MKSKECKTTNTKILNLLKKIMLPYKKSTLTEEEKRFVIFKYLCENISYDYDLLERIRLNIINPSEYDCKRNLNAEFNSVLDNSVGICNAIAQLYKILLSYVDIYSICVCVNDSTEVGHQLNLVYDSITQNYSFDDVTSVIVKRGTINDFFDYDLTKAHSLGQCNTDIIKGHKIVGLSTKYVYNIIGLDFETPKYLENMEMGGYGRMFGSNIPNNIESFHNCDIIISNNKLNRKH